MTRAFTVRALCGLAIAATALSACAKTQRSPVSATSAPAALAGARYCVIAESDTQTRVEPIDACTDDAGVVDADRAESRVAVANAGSEQVLVVQMDLTDPRFLDLDRTIPGSNGLIVPDGPSALASVGHPALVAVGSEDEPALSFVDIAYTRGVGIDVDGEVRDHIGLSGPIGGLEAHGDVLVWWIAPTRELNAARVTVTCGGETGRVASDCTPTVTLTSLGQLRLDADPLAVALTADGSAWVTRRGADDIVQVGLFGDRLETECAGAPCVVDRLPAATECIDGIDNDGDGVIDGDDPQCFTASDLEGGTPLASGDLAACSNGIDDDGDGLTDADDPDCYRADQRREGPRAEADACANGFDDDLDGLTDADDPACADGGRSEFERGDAGETDAAPRRAPRCADGEDNDGDGRIDWPDDPECYGPNSDTEARPIPIEPELITTTPEGDYLLVVDVAFPQLLIFDLTTGERLDPHALIPWRSTPGLSVRRPLPVAMVASNVRSDISIADDDRSMQLVNRVVHVATTSGLAYSFELDRIWTLFDADGAVLDTEVIDRFQRFDSNNALGEIDRVTCDVPRDALNFYGVLDLECDDPVLPRPAVLDDTLLTEDATTYSIEDGDAFGTLPRRFGYTNVSNDADAETPTAWDRPLDEFAVDITWDYATGGDDWRMIYEGLIPGTDRDDALLADDGWVEILGADPCEVDTNVCTLGLDLGECPEARDLCAAGADLCADRYHICSVCPQACRGAIDFCESGVVAGDRVVLDRLSPSQVVDDACAPFAVASAENTDASVGPLEYEVVAVRPGAVRIAPLPDADLFDPPLPTELPPLDCYTEPFEIEVRAGASWIAVGDDEFGHPSPFFDAGGACEPLGDAEVRASRPRLDETWTGIYGLTMRLESGTEPPQRDFMIRFEVDDNFADREIGNLQLLVGARTSDMFEVDTDRGPRLIIADQAQNFVHVYNARTFFEVDSPLP